MHIGKWSGVVPRLHSCFNMPVTVQCVDMHTNGEPLRIIVSSSPALQFPDGANIVEKRRYLRTEADWLRRVLMREPRGHSDMYGVFLTSPDSCLPSAHLAVLFCHNEGYSTMCGHGTLALARYAVDRKMVETVENGEAGVVIQCPCGVAEASAEVKEGRTTGRTHFLAPPGYLHAAELSMNFNDKPLTFDIAYGGAYYVLVTANDLGIDISSDGATKIIQITNKFKREVRSLFPITHDDPRAPPDYLFIYGVILADDRLSAGPQLKQVIEFADGQIDRSPCGSATAARLSALASRGLVKEGDRLTFANPLVGEQSVFEARITRVGGPEVAMGIEMVAVDKATQCEIHGKAYYTGETKFIVEEKDSFPEGFVVKQ